MSLLPPIVYIVLATGLATGLGLTPARAKAAPARDSADSAKIAYDTSDLGDAFDGFGPEITDAVGPLLREAGHLDVRIRVYWKNIDEFHYGISVAVHPGSAIEDAPEVATCRDCSSAQLEEAVVLGVEIAIAGAKLEQAAAQPESPEPGEVTEPAASAGPAPSSAADDSPAGPLGPLGKGGVASLALGVPALTSGIALVVLKETRPPEDKSQFRDLRPTGYALLATGGLLVAGGVALLVLDARRGKRPATARRLTPLLGLRAIGLRGRF